MDFHEKFRTKIGFGKRQVKNTAFCVLCFSSSTFFVKSKFDALLIKTSSIKLNLNFNKNTFMSH